MPAQVVVVWQNGTSQQLDASVGAVVKRPSVGGAVPAPEMFDMPELLVYLQLLPEASKDSAVVQYLARSQKDWPRCCPENSYADDQTAVSVNLVRRESADQAYRECARL